MPNCLFVLQRFFLRVDGVVYKMYDTRFFLEFHKPYCIREFQKREATYDDILAQLNQVRMASLHAFCFFP